MAELLQKVIKDKIMPLLSVIIPVYNEAKTILEILEKINAVPVDKEMIVVDDGSTDGSERALRQTDCQNLKVIHHTRNRGKGAAFLTGFANASGEYVIIQDADLEYEPGEYLKLIAALRQSSADIVLGVRFTKGYHGLLIPKLGNRVLTTLLNILFGCRLNDFMTCYKLFRRDVINGLEIKARSFDLEAEIVAKAIKRKMRICEVPITYHPRNYHQGKKIRLKDGLAVIMAIIKYRFCG